ncbi:MAG: histidine phosphatase family protein [Oscillospiraceae bacterium]|nr:histidine phosphatase family protein [Oscillospiraceae bacterium]
MICYLVRHGKDDETVRGGWSQHPLSPEGIAQVQSLASELAKYSGIQKIYSSDLCRAMETANILADRLHLSVTALPQFRETNNGDLAGMKNELAVKRYPDLFWNQLGWEETYPNGESPKQFYERICRAWDAFSREICTGSEDVILVTHGGVIQVLLSILSGETYSNKGSKRPVPYASMIPVQYEKGTWRECKQGRNL